MQPACGCSGPSSPPYGLTALVHPEAPRSVYEPAPVEVKEPLLRLVELKSLERSLQGLLHPVPRRANPVQDTELPAHPGPQRTDLDEAQPHPMS